MGFNEQGNGMSTPASKWVNSYTKTEVSKIYLHTVARISYTYVHASRDRVYQGTWVTFARCGISARKKNTVFEAFLDDDNCTRDEMRNNHKRAHHILLHHSKTRVSRFFLRTVCHQRTTFCLVTPPGSKKLRTYKEITESLNKIAGEDYYSKWSESEVWFAHALFEQATKFPRLSYVNVPIGEMKNNFKLIKQICEAEPALWSSPPAKLSK